MSFASSRANQGNILLLFTLTCFFIAACGEQKPPVQLEAPALTVQRSIEAVADEYLAAVLERYPEMGTAYSIPGASHDRLYDNSLSALAAWEAREDAWWQELQNI